MSKLRPDLHGLPPKTALPMQIGQLHEPRRIKFLGSVA